MERAFGVFDLCMDIEAEGYDYKTAGHLPLGRNELIPDDACVVLNGPAARVAELSQKRCWAPRGWCDPNAFACRTYYGYWPSHVLQQRFVFLPLGSLADEQSNIFANIATEHGVFIRPDSSDKSFDGAVVKRGEFDLWIRRVRSAETPPNTLCVVSKPQVVENEWRLVVRGRRTIAGSSYRIGGRVDTTQAPPAAVIKFAESVASDPYPGLPDIYVMDVASTGNRLAVVEVGSVNACGFYGCDRSAVIRAISEEAEHAWNRG